MKPVASMLGGACAVLCAGSWAVAAPVVGTPGPDVLFFQGMPGNLNTTLLSPTGLGFAVNGAFNINSTTYDGLGGTDNLLLTNDNDALFGADVQNVEFIRSGNGNDIADLSTHSISLFIDGGGHDDIIFSGLGDDTLRGGSGNDILDGGAGQNAISGEEGNDILIASLGDNVFRGGEGIDTVLFHSAISLLSITSINIGHNGELVVDFVNVGGAVSSITAFDTELFEIGGVQLGPQEFINSATSSSVPSPATWCFIVLGMCLLTFMSRTKRLQHIGAR